MAARGATRVSSLLGLSLRRSRVLPCQRSAGSTTLDGQLFSTACREAAEETPPRKLLKEKEECSRSSFIEEVRQWDASVPIERATTPPASWYTSRAFFRQEAALVFHRGWQQGNL